MGKLDGKVAIVIGSTSGIGKATAKLYAKEGATVIITGRRIEKGEAVVDEITAEGGQADFYKLDCSILQECYDLVEDVVVKHGRLDILFYNAGVSTKEDPAESLFDNMTEELWDYVMSTNLTNAFFMSKKAMSELKKTKGNVLFTASVAGLDAVIGKDIIAYGVSKAALLYMTKALALNVAGEGVRINAIAPGFTDTDILAQSSKEYLDAMCATIPIKRLCTAEEMASAALYLSSDDAASVTGHIMVIDGGVSL